MYRFDNYLIFVILTLMLQAIYTSVFTIVVNMINCNLCHRHFGNKKDFLLFLQCWSLSSIYESQEPITRSMQLTYFRATAFSQVRFFLDTPSVPTIVFKSKSDAVHN